MTTITLPRATVEQALEALEAAEFHAKRRIPDASIEVAVQPAITALRAALAQQAKPQGCDHCNHPLYAATRCRVCGRVTQQAEPVEPVAWRWGYRSVTTGEMDWRGYVEIAADPNLRSPAIIMEPLYTAPPQRKPLTEEEIDAIAATNLGDYEDDKWFLLFARAIERAHGIGGQDAQV